jgi:hypothetical protein
MQSGDIDTTNLTLQHTHRAPSPPTISLPGGTFRITRVTRQARSKNTRSIANRMPTVCTAPQRSISNAASGPNARHPSNPRKRANHFAARTVLRTQTLPPRIMQP